MAPTLALAAGHGDEKSLVEFRPAVEAGPILFGALVSSLLVGCSLALCHTYFQTFFKADRLWVKAAVVTVALMDSTQFVLITALLYYGFILNWASPSPWIYLKMHWSIHALVSAIVHIAVQGLFVHRVKQLTKQQSIWVICTLCFAARIVGLVAIGFIVPLYSYLSVNQLTDRFTVLGTICLSAGVVGDLLVASSLSYCLWKLRDGSVPRKFNLATQVIVFVLQTGLLTSLSSLIYLICLLLWPHDLIWAGMSLIVPRIYTISLTASLNNRTHLQKTIDARAQLSLWNIDGINLEERLGDDRHNVELEFADMETKHTTSIFTVGSAVQTSTGDTGMAGSRD